MQVEKIQARIETYTSNLATAVQSGSGAQFSLLMSMIAANQELPEDRRSGGEGFELPTAELSYPNPNEMYNEEVAGRLNVSVNEHQRGEFAYLNSHIHTGALTPRQARHASDSWERAALISAGAMLNEINTSRGQISQTA